MKHKCQLTCFVAFAGIFLFALGGCAFTPFAGQSGQVNLTSQTADHFQLNGDFNTACYRFDSSNRVTIVLVDGTLRSPRQAAIIRLFWQPFAGYTPVDPAATNATVEYVVFGDSPTATAGIKSQVGIYSGAGFVYPDNSPGQAALHASIWQAPVRLTDRSIGFTDQFGASNVKGSFTAKRDAVKVAQILRRINIEIARRLGYPRMVRLDDPQKMRSNLKLAKLGPH